MPFTQRPPKSIHFRTVAKRVIIMRMCVYVCIYVGTYCTCISAYAHVYIRVRVFVFSFVRVSARTQEYLGRSLVSSH